MLSVNYPKHALMSEISGSACWAAASCLGTSRVSAAGSGGRTTKWTQHVKVMIAVSGGGWVSGEVAEYPEVRLYT